MDELEPLVAIASLVGVCWGWGIWLYRLFQESPSAQRNRMRRQLWPLPLVMGTLLLLVLLRRRRAQRPRLPCLLLSAGRCLDQRHDVLRVFSRRQFAGRPGGARQSCCDGAYLWRSDWSDVHVCRRQRGKRSGMVGGRVFCGTCRRRPAAALGASGRRPCRFLLPNASPSSEMVQPAFGWRDTSRHRA